MAQTKRMAEIFLKMVSEQVKAIFKKFDKYVCIKNDKWYKDNKKVTCKNCLRILKNQK